MKISLRAVRHAIHLLFRRPKGTRSRSSRKVWAVRLFRRLAHGTESTFAQPHWKTVARRPATSLRFRLLGCVALALITSLGFGGAIACWNASRVAQTEMRTVLAVREQNV